jgi:hypothetical protein
MRIGLFCLGTNLILVIILVGPFLQVGLAAANAFSAEVKGLCHIPRIRAALYGIWLGSY